MTILKPIMTLSLALSLLACSSIKLQPPAVAKLKRVAIVGYQAKTDFSAEKASTASEVASTISGFEKMGKAFKGEFQLYDLSGMGYEGVRAALVDKFAWDVLPMSTVLENEEYQRVLKEKRQGPNLSKWSADKLLLPFMVSRMTPMEQRALVKALDVDAIVAVQSDYDIGNTSGFALGGLGVINNHPRAKTSVFFFDGGAEPLWLDRGARGKATEKGAPAVKDAMNEVSVQSLLSEAAQKSYDALFARYDEAKVKAEEQAAEQ